METFLQFWICISAMTLFSQCQQIDFSSIDVVPEFYQLCWKMLKGDPPKYLYGFKNTNTVSFPVFEKLQDSQKQFCIEHKDNKVSYRVTIPTTENSHKCQAEFLVYFSLPLLEPLPFIRKRIVPAGVSLQLNGEFASISNRANITCTVLFLFTTNGKTSSTSFNLSTLEKSVHFQQLSPYTKFKYYYSCGFNNLEGSYSKFLVNHDTTYPRETTEPLLPFLSAPFRRYLMGQWKIPSYNPDNYKVAIYEINNSFEKKCIKIFRLQGSTKNKMKTIKVSDCGPKVLVEDFKTPSGNNYIYFLFDMVNELQFNKRYQMSIFWLNEKNEISENFIYFEPFPNENSGIIKTDIIDYHGNGYIEKRNIVPDFRQNIINKYRSTLSIDESISTDNATELAIIPSISLGPPSKIEKKTHITYNYLYQECESKPQCKIGPHPFFYLLVKSNANKQKIVEIIRVPKKETLSPAKNITMKPISDNLTFTISWYFNENPITNIPSMFAVQIRQDNGKCMSLYIIECKSCNQGHKQESEKNSSKTISAWKEECNEKVTRLENHYEAMDPSITFSTKTMIPKEIFNAKIFAINLIGNLYWGESNPAYIEGSINQSTGLWTILFSVFGSIIGVGLLVLLVLRCRALVQDPVKEINDVENVYYDNNDN